MAARLAHDRDHDENAAQIGREIEFPTVNAGFWALLKRRVDMTSHALIS
jgi:hypothetical protein